MTKKEVIWREILFQTIENKKTGFTQKELAQKYGFSLSTVFNSLKVLRASHIVAGKRGFKIQDAEKLLYLWATFRKLKKDVIYQTTVEGSVFDIEGQMPPGAVFGAFSAYSKKYKDFPADYDKVYIYFKKEDLDILKSRFPLKQGKNNLIVLEPDPWLMSFAKNGTTPDCQTFADLWNLSDWYAKDFLNSLKSKII